MDTSTEKLIHNLQKESDAVEKAKKIKFLHVEKTLTLKNIAEQIQIHPSYISHYLRILELPSIVLDGYYAKQISSAHLFILSRLKDEEDVQKAYKEILANNLNTARAEEVVREIKFSVTSSDKRLSKEQIEEMMADIQKSFPQVKTKIIQTRIKGKLILEFKGNTELSTEFLKRATEKLGRSSYPEVIDDTLQVLE